MTRVTIFLLSLLLVGPAEAQTAKAKKNSLQCSAHHLKVKSCVLEGLNLRVQVTESRISIYDGVWRSLEDFPLPGGDVEWKSVRLVKLGDKKLLEMQLWDHPLGSVGIQSLVWIVYEIKDLQLTKEFQEVLQKRSVVQLEGETITPERTKGQFEVPPQPRYLYDRLEKSRMFIDKQGRLNWEIGNRKRYPTTPAQPSKK